MNSVEVFPQAELQEERRQADCGDYKERERTQECASPGVENDESESEKKQASGDEGPAARLGRRSWIGSGIRHGRCQRYTGGKLWVSNRRELLLAASGDLHTWLGEMEPVELTTPRECELNLRVTVPLHAERAF